MKLLTVFNQPAWVLQTKQVRDGIGDCLKPNLLSRRGIKPYLTLNAHRPTTINYIQSCVPVPPGFTAVKTIEVVSDDLLVIHGQAGKHVRVPCARHSSTPANWRICSSGSTIIEQFDRRRV
ncbi:MAG: hypothetical protein WCS70_11545 [Verrucomicrobiota bacterium]